MSQALLNHSPTPNSKKNKMLATIGAVVIGHAGLLWALSQMSPMTLKPINPPKPIQVRIVQLEKPKEQKQQPPAPVVPPKPQEVKIIDTPPPPPKKVEKIQQVKKEVIKPKVVQPPKPTQVEAPIVAATVTETVTPKPAPVVAKSEPVVSEPVAKPTPPAPAAPSVDLSPRNLGDAAGVAWKRKPKPTIDQRDLDKITNNVIVLRIDVDAKGKIKARIVQSSGNPKVDREMVRAVQAAQFQPYKEDGVAVPFYAEQPFRVQ